VTSSAVQVALVFRRQPSAVDGANVMTAATKPTAVSKPSALLSPVSYTNCLLFSTRYYI